jgi:signal transduction histidine kinase
VVEVVAGRRAAWSAYAEEHGVELQADMPEHPVPALLVDGHLEQILDNLIDNAIEATPAGRAVTLLVRAGSAAVEVHVIDEGPGMSPGEMARAFDRFWQGRRGERTGTGLGLPIAAQLARAGGGTLHLQAARSGGVDALISLACD